MSGNKNTISRSIESLNNEITIDSKIDREHLDVELLNIPFQYGKWINIHAIERAFLIKFGKQLKRLKPLKFDYYKGNVNDDYLGGKISPVTYSKIQSLEKVEADPEVYDLTEKIELQNIKVDMIAEFIKAITSKGWNLRTAVDYIKFKNGA